MKYEASKAEVIRFDGNYFMASSVGYTCGEYTSNPPNCQGYNNTNNGVHCGDYQQGSRCGGFSYPGFTCGEYNGISGTVNGKWYENDAPACSIF